MLGRVHHDRHLLLLALLLLLTREECVNEERIARAHEIRVVTANVAAATASDQLCDEAQRLGRAITVLPQPRALFLLVVIERFDTLFL